MRTQSAKPSEVEKKWFLIDAEGLVLGRMAAIVADLLRGKHKTQYTPHIDTGDNVIVINASKVRVTGRKADQKIYYRHTGYVGGIKQATYREMKEKDPKKTIQHAVRKMLPRNFLTSRRIKNLIFIEDQK